MVKLIRLKSEQDKLYFNNNIQSDLVLKPNSKIALQNVSFEKANDEIVIDASNNTLTFDNDTFTSTITLTNGSYTRVNIVVVFDEIQRKLNASLSLNEWNLGKAFFVDTSSSNFLTINTTTGGDWIPATNSDFTRTGVISTGTGVMRKSSAATEGTPDAFVATGKYPFFQGDDGCGIFRVQIESLPTTGDGFFIGLSTTAPANAGATVQLSDMTYLIYAQNTSANYSYVDNEGALTPSSVSIENVSAGADNDYMQIGSYDGAIHLTVYNSSNPDGIDLNPTPLPYDGDLLYPYIVFFDQTGVYASESYYVPEKVDEPSLVIQPQPSLLGATNITNQNRADRDIGLKFESKVLSDQLGFFEEAILMNDLNLTWKAIRTIRYFDETECYLVEALNLQFKSYDGSKGQEKRRNLLAVIQNIRDRSQADVLYDSNSLTYIDINNSHPLPLRNLQFRILNSDEGEVAVDGNSNMTVLID